MLDAESGDSLPESETAPSPEDRQLAREWAEVYRSRGMQPLPSSPKEKRPLIRYAHLWESKAPDDLFDKFSTGNVQVMLGRYWRLLVMDLDGIEARTRFEAMAEGIGKSPIPPTWITHSGGDGYHLWFRLPEGLNQPLPKAVLWKSDTSHTAIERLCDRSLIMAPPSIHPKTKQRYKFLDKKHSPLKLPLPALCPNWILKLPPIEKPKPKPISIPMARPANPVVTPSSRRYLASDVLDAIDDKVSLAASWGLRVASHSPNHSGWCSCHAIGREDRTPSAAISATSGRYWEPGEQTMSLFELGVHLGIYLDWRDAMGDLGERFRVREAG